MAAFQVAKARTGHLADIPGIELAGATMFSEADLPREVRYRVTAAEDLRAALDHGRLWTAASGGVVVGFAMADIVDQAGYLAEVAVLPDFGRRGIGTQLVNAAIAWARDQGFRSLSLVTFRHLPWNAPFYEKLGFVPIGTAEHGPELEGLMDEEERTGIDRSMRVAMTRTL